MLARREPVTLRSLVAGTGVSTMAVYTYFDGMPGLWGAVRQEGFTRLERRLATEASTRDPVRDLASLGIAYIENGLANPDLYRVMFDATFDMPEPDRAAATFSRVVEAVQRAIDRGRFNAASAAGDVGLRYWANGHGITSLAVSGVLTPDELRRHAPAIAIALFTDAGDDRPRARRSVNAAWAARGTDATDPGKRARRAGTKAVRPS